MHTVPGETCDQIANHTSNLEPHLVCHQLHELYGCDCNGCECLRVPPSSPPDPAGPPPLLPPLPPMAPAGEDPIQIFAMVLLIFVIGAMCGALCLVGSCLLGWLDQGALRSPAAPMRHPPAAPAATYHHTPHTAHHTPHTTHHTPHTTHRRHPPAAPVPVRLAVAGDLKRKPADQVQQLMAWGKRKAAQKARRARGLQSPERLRDGERSPSMSPSAATPESAAKGSSMTGIALCEITAAATPSIDPTAGGAG